MKKIMTNSNPFDQLKVGDTVCYRIGDKPPYDVYIKIITSIDRDFIICGDSTFSRATGNEIDPLLDWNMHTSGAFISEPLDEKRIQEEFLLLVKMNAKDKKAETH